MMTFSPIDDMAFDEAQVQIGYCKLFPLILKDFISRIDAVQMMKPNNLPFFSNVAVNPGQVVTGSGASGPITGSTVSPGNGKGQGTVTPIYDGSVQHGANAGSIAEKKAIKNAGGVTTQAVLNTALGQ